jgi:hypothetical protein
MEFFGEDKASTPLYQNVHRSPTLRTALQFGIIFTPILFTKGGESLKKGLYFPHKSISPKQKDRTTTNFKNL